MLLKSWAMPPVSWPTASIFCDWRSCSATARRACSARLRSVTFWMVVRTAGLPSSSIWLALSSTSMIEPSLRAMAQSRDGPGADADRVLLAQGRHRGQILRRVEVVAGHGERFLARPAVLRHRRVVDREDVAGLAVDDDHRIGIGVEQHAVAILGGRQFGLAALAFGDVDADHDPAAAGQVDGIEAAEVAACAGDLEHAALVEAGDALVEPGIPVRLGILEPRPDAACPRAIPASSCRWDRCSSPATGGRPGWRGSSSCRCRTR